MSLPAKFLKNQAGNDFIFDAHYYRPSLDARQIERKQMKLAMSVGNNKHYRIDEVMPRHFFQTGESAGLSKSLIREAVADIASGIDEALASLENELPNDFPQDLHESVKAGIQRRGRLLENAHHN